MGHGYFLARSEPFTENRRNCCCEEEKKTSELKTMGGKGEREREEHAADICASNYLKTLPNAFWHYIISW